MSNIYNKIATFQFILFTIILYISYGIIVHKTTEIPTDVKYTQITDTIIKYDTIIVEQPKPISVIKYKDRILHDTIVVENKPIIADIPFEEKEYQDTNYYIKISGFEPNIDELKIFQNEKIITNTITKQKRFNYGLVGGIGYGMINKKTDLWIGFGISYNF